MLQLIWPAFKPNNAGGVRVYCRAAIVDAEAWKVRAEWREVRQLRSDEHTIEDAGCGANDRLAIAPYIPRDTQTGGEVLVIAVIQRSEGRA